MHAKSLVPLFSTEKIGESKEFYTRHFGFEVVYEEARYVGLRLGDEGGPEVSFMAPQDEFGGTGRGPGLIFCFEVSDVDAEYSRLQGEGVTDLSRPEDKPWGDRCTMLSDPNGITLYLYHPVREAQGVS